MRLQEAVLDLPAAAEFLATPAAGGIDIFIGTTRRWTGEDETVRLEYECYEPMALKEIGQLLAAATERWPVLKAVVFHRLGVVPVSEASVIIGVATAHRAAAFEACRYLIDRLKVQVPIWKREVYADGRTEWVQGSQAPEISE